MIAFSYTKRSNACLQGTYIHTHSYKRMMCSDFQFEFAATSVGGTQFGSCLIGTNLRQRQNKLASNKVLEVNSFDPLLKVVGGR